jgi:hypothetical protein
MFETIGSTTYRLALRRAEQPAIRQMLAILTRDESFHVPLNVHFLREALALSPGSRPRLRALYHATFAALLASTVASRRRAGRFDRIPVGVLARAYATELSRLFLEEHDLGIRPHPILLRSFGLDPGVLIRSPSPVSLEAAERAAEREGVTVQAY